MDFFLSMILKLFCEYIAIYFQFTSHIWKGLVYQNTTIKRKRKKKPTSIKYVYVDSFFLVFFFSSCSPCFRFLAFLCFFSCIAFMPGLPLGGILDRIFWLIFVDFRLIFCRNIVVVKLGFIRRVYGVFS